MPWDHEEKQGNLKVASSWTIVPTPLKEGCHLRETFQQIDGAKWKFYLPIGELRGYIEHNYREVKLLQAKVMDLQANNNH